MLVRLYDLPKYLSSLPVRASKDLFADHLVITHQSTKPGESGLLEEGALQILRCAQDDSQLPAKVDTFKIDRCSSFAALRMTARGFVILNAAKDLFRTYA